MRFLTARDVIDLHERILARGGGTRGVLNRGAIESAVDRHTHGPFPIRPDLALRAALLLRGIAQDHPFADGNKRTGFEAADTFLAENGWFIDARPPDVVAFMLHVAGRRFSVAAPPDVLGIAEWIRSRLKRL